MYTEKAPVPGHSRYHDVHYNDDGSVLSLTSHFPLRRDLANLFSGEELPVTPPGLDLIRFPHVGMIRRLLSPSLLVQFEEDLEVAPPDMMNDIVQEWGADAIGLHDGNYQHTVEFLEDGRHDELELYDEKGNLVTPQRQQ